MRERWIRAMVQTSLIPKTTQSGFGKFGVVRKFTSHLREWEDLRNNRAKKFYDVVLSVLRRNID
jgi:hypothetical protein